ncbi:MAG TPA: Ig-like domain-containing protein, partial [Leptospiraceae bacterium]|nr:Ig-like domain-containing protein [Leptospiraceae bacterium]
MNCPYFQSGLPQKKGVVFALFLAVSGIPSCSKNAANLPGILFAPGSATRPSVVLSSPSALTPNVPSDIPVYVEFDREMRPNETENAFTLSGSAPTPGHFVWSGKRLEYRLDGPLATGNSFVLVQSGSSISKDGYPMEVDYIVHFISGSSVTGPQVLSVAPANNSQNVATTSTIRFIFSRPMDIPSTQTAFSIS